MLKISEDSAIISSKEDFYISAYFTVPVIATAFL